MAFKRSLFSIFKVARRLSTGKKALEQCYLVGRHGAIAYPGRLYVSMDEHLGRQFLTPIPSDSLYGETQSPYEMDDKARLVLRSCGHSAFFLTHTDIKYVNPFRRDNVGILKGEGVIVFRKLEVSLRSEDYYGAVVYYLKDLVEDYHPGITLLQLHPLDLLKFWKDFGARSVLTQNALYHPTTMPLDTFADICTEIRRLVTHDMPTSGHGSHSQAIVERIGRANPFAVRIILSNGLLVQFMPEYARRKFPPLAYPYFCRLRYNRVNRPIYTPFTALPIKGLPESDLYVGYFLADTMRHNSVHSVEKQVVVVARGNFKNFKGSVTRPLVLRVARAQFPDFVADAVEAFSSENKWGLLRLKDRFPLLKLYTTPVPLGSKAKDKAEYSKAHNNKQSGGTAASSDSD